MSATRIPRLLSTRGYQLQARHFSSLTQRRSAWTPMPSPPRLPKEEQEMFEKLREKSMGAFSQPQAEPSEAASAQESGSARRTPMQINQSPASSGSEAPSTDSTLNARLNAKGDGEELHPNVRRGAPPEFEGEKNPKTGEVGGPKNEPLRWGDSGDWSYNGRVTDF